MFYRIVSLRASGTKLEVVQMLGLSEYLSKLARSVARSLARLIHYNTDDTDAASGGEGKKPLFQ